MVQAVTKLVLALSASVAYGSVLPRQVSQELTDNTGITNSSAVTDVAINLISDLPAVSLDDGTTSLFEAEGVVAQARTLLEVTPAVVAQQVNSGALDDVVKDDTSSSLTKRATAKCGLPALIQSDPAAYFAGVLDNDPALGNAPGSLTSDDKSITFYNQYTEGDIGGSIIGAGYMTYKTLASSVKNPSSQLTGPSELTSSYVKECANYCASTSGCKTFNLFQQFGNPTYEPAASTTPVYSFGVRCALYSQIYTGYEPVASGSSRNINAGQWSKDCIATSTQQTQAPFAGSSDKGAARYVQSGFSLLYSSGTAAINCPSGYDSVFRPRDDDLTSSSPATGAVNAATVKGNFLASSVISQYSPTDCGALCAAHQKCTFFDLYQVSQGDGPGGFIGFGPSQPAKPKGVPKILTPLSNVCALYHFRSSPSRRTNYGQYTSGNAAFKYIHASLGCAIPSSTLDPAEDDLTVVK